MCAHCKRKSHSGCAASHSGWRYRSARKDVLSKLPTFDSASLLRSSSLCLRRGRRRSFTGPISAHHGGLRGTPSTSTLGLALGRACRLRVEAPLRASLAATHALLAIASERSGAERPVPTLIVVHDPRSACEGSHRAVPPVVLARHSRSRSSMDQVDNERLVHLGPSDSLRRSITKPD